MKSPSRHLSGNILFFFGIGLGLLLTFAISWASYESFFYFYTGETFAPFHGLRCPLFMTYSETGTLQANFNNSSQEEIHAFYRMTVSGAALTVYEEEVVLPPQSSKSIEWQVDANDIDLETFILAKFEVLPNAYFDSSAATCGIMVINLPFLTGSQVFTAALAVSLLAILLGFFLWESTNDPLQEGIQNRQHARQALGIILMLGLLSGLIGWWLPGMIFCGLTLLTLLIVLRLSLT